MRRNIWDAHAQGHYIAIPTNTVTNRDKAVMGAGLAKDCRDRFPGIDKRLGHLYKVTGPRVVWFYQERLVMVPTKKWFSDEYADFDLIEKSMASVAYTLRQLRTDRHPSGKLPLILPALGCGRFTGKRTRQQVEPLIHRACEQWGVHDLVTVLWEWAT